MSDHPESPATRLLTLRDLLRDKIFPVATEAEYRSRQIGRLRLVEPVQQKKATVERSLIRVGLSATESSQILGLALFVRNAGRSTQARRMLRDFPRPLARELARALRGIRHPR